MTTMKKQIGQLAAKLGGLKNDTRYWDLRRMHGDWSGEVLRYLRSLDRIQTHGENHT